MKYVEVPKDLKDIKEQVILGLTKKQLIGFGSALVIGIPVFLTTRTVIGNDLSLFLTIAIMVIPIFLTIYKSPTGNSLKEIIKIYLKYHFISYGLRPYQTNNYFSPYTGINIERRKSERKKKK